MKTENQLQLVTFEQAKRLKEVGFDWEYFYYYRADGNDIEINICPINWNRGQISNFFINAPSVALALKWFRDRKTYYGYVEPMVFFNEFEYWIKRPGYLEHKWSACQYDTCESAESALLDELLTLIEKQNEK